MNKLLPIAGVAGLIYLLTSEGKPKTRSNPTKLLKTLIEKYTEQRPDAALKKGWV